MTDSATERRFERVLFASRWLLAPMYAGLVGALLLLLISFARELLYVFGKLPNLTQNDAILGALTLIDLSLAANLVLIVIFSGYENFVSRLDTGGTDDRFEWQGKVDFAALKLKLVASIVAISGIHLLKVFMNLKEMAESEIMWMILIHLVFVVSGVLLALMDRIAADTMSTQKAGKAG